MRKNIEWLLVTVFVGLFPVLIRFVFSIFLSKNASFQPIQLSDMIAWGLIANISIFNGRNSLFKYNAIISNFSTIISPVIIGVCILIYTLDLVNEVSSINGTKILFEKDALFSGGMVVCCLTLAASILCFVFSSDKKVA